MSATDTLYQQVRSHLAYLKLTAAAEALPGQLDAAREAGATHTEFLAALLGVEVDATEARRPPRPRQHHPNRPRPMTGAGKVINLNDWCPTCHRRLDPPAPDEPDDLLYRDPATGRWRHTLCAIATEASPAGRPPQGDRHELA